MSSSVQGMQCLSPTWSDMLICNDCISITLHQPKTDPFLGGQSIHIHATSTTCPVRAMHNYHDIVTTQWPYELMFSASTIQPLSCQKLTPILRQLLSQATLCPSNYASNNFRIGTTTTVAAIGLNTINNQDTRKME